MRTARRAIRKCDRTRPGPRRARREPDTDRAIPAHGEAARARVRHGVIAVRHDTGDA